MIETELVAASVDTAGGLEDVGDYRARQHGLHVDVVVPGVGDLEWGGDVSPEGLGQGHTHAFTLTFSSEADRDAYIVHPHHKAFVEWVSPFIERALVVDYWAKG